MAENEKDQGQESKEPTREERIDAIKREEKEDASAYYAQGSHDDHSGPDYRPVERVEPAAEEMSFLKTIAFLGFGFAVLAIIFILFFIQDLDDRVVQTDQKIDAAEKKVDSSVAEMQAAVSKIQGEFGPFKEEMSATVETINKNVYKLKGQIGDYERMMAIMELKRSMVTIKEIMTDSPPEVKSKTGVVLGSIETLLGELGAGIAASASVAEPSAEGEGEEEEAAEGESGDEETAAEGEGEEEEAAEGESGDEETAAEEEGGEEEAAEEESGDEETAAEEEGEEEEAAEEESGDEETAAKEESDGEHAKAPAVAPAPERHAAADMIPALTDADADGHGADSHVGEIKLTHGSGDDELPPIEELLKDE